MKDRIFSFKLYLQGIKKVRAGGIAAAICVIVLNAILPIVAMIDRSNIWPGTEIRTEEVAVNNFAPFGLLFIAFAPLLVFVMFSYLNERSKSDFYHSLPHTRTCVYVSFTAAILSWITAILLASSLVNAILWLCVPYYHLSLATVLISFINFFVLAIMMMGFMSLAMMLTGTTISNLLIFVLVTLFARAIGTFFLYSIVEMNHVFLLEESWLSVISIEYFLPYYLLIEIFSYKTMLASAGMLIYSLAVGIALLAVSGLLYNKRRSEIAGQSAPNKKLQTVYRSAVTLPFLLIMAFLLITEGLESYQVILLAVAIVVYILFELMTTKKIKDTFKSLSKFFIPVLGALIFICGVFFANNTINSMLPTPDEITGITVISSRRAGNSYENYQTSNIKINDARANEIISAALVSTADGSIWEDGNRTSSGHSYVSPERRLMGMDVIIGRKGKSDIARSIYMLESDYNEVIERFTSSNEYLEAYTKLPAFDEVSSISVGYQYVPSDKKNELYQSFVKEYNALSTEQKLKLKEEANAFYYGNSTSLTFEVSGIYESNYFTSHYPLNLEYTPATTRLAVEFINISELGNSPKTAIRSYYDTTSQTELGKIGSYYCSIAISKLFDDSMNYSISTSHSKDGSDIVALHNKTADFLSTSATVFDFEDTSKKLYKIQLTFEDFEAGEYSYLNVIVALSDEEAKEIIKDLEVSEMSYGYGYPETETAIID